MAKCQFCNVEVPDWDKKTMSHLVVTKDATDGSFHTHGPIESPGAVKELINAAREVVDLSKEDNKFTFKEIIFHNRQRIGDMIMFTCAVRDFKKAYPDVRVGVISTAMHIWDYSPYVDRKLVAYYKNGKTLETITPQDFLNGNTNVLKIGPGWMTNASNRIDWHFANAYRVSIENALGIHIPQGESRGDVWVTEKEYNAPRVFEQPYWLIVTSGEKGWGCKMYPDDRWQAFVDQNPDVMFVQLGAAGDNPTRLKGKNVIDYVGKTEDRNTGLRDLVKLFLNAEGSISLVSFAMHLSGALHKPAIVVAGAREPVSFTQYAGHRYLSTDGCLPCGITACWHCDIKACTALNSKNQPMCVDMITPEDLTRALRSYYIGGRLKIGVPSEKPKQFKNVVKTPEEIPVPVPVNVDITKYGMEWGGGCITKEDWDFIQQVIKDNNIKTVLEFGTGLSTLLMADLGVKVITYETMEGWIEKIHGLNPKVDIRLWKGESLNDVTKDGDPTKFDMAFVDGPAGGRSREFSTKIASELSDLIIVHDASRPNEMKWQEKYLKKGFIGPGGGGRRCHMWSKSPKIGMALRTGSPLYIQKEGEDQGRPVVSQEKPVVEAPKTCGAPQAPACNRKVGVGKKYIKFVSTARGWGGCARSITTLMKFLLKDGHKVEFIPFRNLVGASEFKQYIKDFLPDLIVTETYNSLKESCDVLFMYGDDYIWEFGTPDIVETFSNLNADRKIMMLNYRRGKVGEIPWTRDWDKYMFLNSTQEKELLKVHPGVKTKVLPPCTELEEFLKIQPNYNTNLRIVRHSSQGDTKFDKDNFPKEVEGILLNRKDAEITMLPGPSFIPVVPNGRFMKVPRTASAAVIAKFLGTGNLFWYSLPGNPQYMDMGPRVVLEAMAAGLPVLADNWGGAVDRVTEDTGWLCNTKEEHQIVIKEVTPELLEEKGKAAKQRAIDEFRPEAWIKEIVE